MTQVRRGQSAAHVQRLVVMIPSLDTGGAELQLTELFERAPIASLQRFRITILTFSSQISPVLVERLSALRIDVVTIDRSSTSAVTFTARLIAYLRRERPDIVHTVLGGSTGTWGRIAARLAAVPQVMHSERSLAPTLTRLQGALEPVVNRLTDRFIVNANAIQKRLVRRGAPEARIRVLPNGVALDRFDPTSVPRSRSAWDIPEDAIVAGFLGMLRPEKRPELFLDAVLSIPREARPDYVVIAGDGALREALRAKVEADPWLNARCLMLGVVSDTPTFLASIDFLVLSSDTEGLPNAVLEAMAMARPIVATAVSDVPQLIEGCGVSVEPGNVEALAGAIAEMTACTSEERATLGAIGRQSVERCYDISQMAARFLDLHLDMLGSQP